MSAIAPDRIHVMPAGQRPLDEWVREHTDGLITLPDAGRGMFERSLAR